MASAKRLTPETLNAIAAQIAGHAPRSMRLTGPGAPAGIGESLKVWVLPYDRLMAASGSMAERVRETRLWHHQLYRGDEALHFACTRESESHPSGHEVAEIAISPLSRALKETIAWTDANIPEEADAVIIKAPDYFLTALWLKGPGIDAVVISSMADGIKGLAINRKIESDRFLAKLAESSPVGNLGDRPDPDSDPERSEPGLGRRVWRWLLSPLRRGPR